MKLRPFEETVGLGREKIDEEMGPIRARQVRSQANLEMAKLAAYILTRETEVQEMCVNKEINLQHLIDKLDELYLLERRKKQYGEVLDQLFPEK